MKIESGVPGGLGRINLVRVGARSVTVGMGVRRIEVVDNNRLGVPVVHADPVESSSRSLLLVGFFY